MVLELFTASLNIVFLSNLFFLFFGTISFFGYLSLNKFLLLNKINHSFLLIKFSLILSMFILFGGVINLLFPISDTIVVIIYFIGLIIFISKLIKKENIIELKWIFIFFLFITLYLYNSGENNDFSYHSHHISLYKNYNLFNFNQNVIDYRIKYNSSYLLLNSLTYLSNLFISIKFLSAFIFGLFILDIRKLIQDQQNPLIIKILSLFALICFLLALSKFKNIGTDYTAHLIYISLILFYLLSSNLNKNFFESKDFFLIFCSILSLLVILKISMILCSLLLFHYLFIVYKKKNFFNVFSFYLFFPITLVLIWVFQNYILSKCLIYPLSQLCFLDYPELKSVIFEHNMINLFAKSVKINYWEQPIETLQEMNLIGYWFPFWTKDHFWKILEKFIPAMILFYIFSFKLIKKGTNNLQLIESQKIFLIILFITLIIWFIQTPAMRFGFSYLILNFFILNILILRLLNLDFQNDIKVSSFTIIFNIIFWLMIFYQFVRIYSQ